eukprot:GHVS01056076.1.p1 GENE.GHVS01056076.1~~GHVS01056076.1.p1  ORF type:complete len:603 (+),score=92.46 GHVS01056076.1:32-1840(+)
MDRQETCSSQTKELAEQQTEVRRRSSANNNNKVSPATSFSDLPASPSEHGSSTLSHRKGKGQSLSVVVPSSSHVVRIPFGVNRWILLVAYIVYCFITGPSYFSWASLRDMLFHNGAYAWRCPGGNSTTSPCDAQDTAVNSLLAIIGTSHFVISALAGLVLDSAGPKVTAIIGVLLQMVGWILLGASTETFQAYIPGCVALGAGLDAAFFPCISGANIFPSYVSAVIAVFGAARSASFYIIFFMEIAVVRQGTLKFGATCYGFAGLFLGLCLIIAIFLIPFRPFPQPAKAVRLVENNKVSGQSSRRQSYTGIVDSSDLSQQQQQQQQQQHPHITTDIPRTRRASFVVVASASQAVVDLGLDQVAAEEEEEVPANTRREDALFFLNEILSVFYLPIVVLFIFTVQRCFFFGFSTSALIPDAMEFYKIVAPLSFIPCPFLGLMADKCGIIPVMLLTNSAGTAMIALAMIPGIPCAVACQYLAVLCYCLHVSFLLSQLYCYVADTFSQGNMGKLIGVMCAIAGLINLTTSNMYEFSVSSKSFFPMMSYLLIASAINFGLLGLVWVFKARKAQSSRQLQLTDLQAEQAAAKSADDLDKLSSKAAQPA